MNGHPPMSSSVKRKKKALKQKGVGGGGEIVPIPAGGQLERSHPIGAPGDEITSRIR